ncbi:uncharacterized protein LOC129225165 [Uloborus diversus]|uniref:uncharacterized protein LOC129225165 n=1 Tax=Uloborus diversus TaxID=327109 RepID=UPI00240A5F3E|nr:uncharacterized protein LOC129225165 [Uloborus diversus]
MDIRTLRKIYLYILVLFLPFCAGTHQAFYYHNDQYPIRSPYVDDSRSFMHQLHFPEELRNHPLWDSFWDVYNYDGPHQQSGAPAIQTFSFEDQPRNEYQIPRRDRHRSLPDPGAIRDEAYQRYKDYFFGRFGSNFLE